MFTASPGQAQPIVNEVLANEPGSVTGLEWIELYNDGQTVNLQDFSLQVGDNPLNLPSDVTLSDGEYYIICRRLFATSTSPGFESIWGDSSGIWGDTPFEESIQVPFEVVMSLTNDAGCVELLGGSTVVSSLTWNTGGLDGCSWERVYPHGDSVAQSIDLAGSTPGRLNSLTPAAYDLALTNITVAADDGATSLTFEICNVGLEIVEYRRLYLVGNERVPDDTIDVLELEPISSGDTIELYRWYEFDGLYCSLTAELSEDDRNRNNSLEFMAIGRDYPPVVLSEVMANPQDDLNTEWIELKCRSDLSLDLSAWFVGDALRTNPISSEPVLIQPDGYIVISQDTLAFHAFYPGFSGKCIQPGSWASLNNDGDVVRLVDGFGIEANRFEYDLGFEENYTWCRPEDLNLSSGWGRSANAGGSPGERNEVVSTQGVSALKVTVDPPYVSPDGDGFEDFTTITITAPTADDYTVKIFDRQGRAVRTFFEHSQFHTPSMEWDGLSDAGNRLPVGIYILYVEASGIESVKKPIVVAR